ncbi:hypothetical protein NIES4071_06730 [Calothrix sp. NIES-4071]|nr:hypothetical protein NIES4071_06730 [Calothrix sp. NIES-4071]BAZ55015.1 hypothetical protein NIES4105_06690 [Calothrix sp. NIES-4105]
MNQSIYLVGSLVNHRRRRILEDILSAQAVENQLPDTGLCILLGSDFQQADESEQKYYCNWTREPGRTLLLIPPFETEKLSIPCEWEIIRHSGAKTQRSQPLLQALSPEIRYQLQGKLQTATEIGGAWEDLSINTGYYRKHPHSGIFAITCLPLWSLAVIDLETELKTWLEKLHSIAGRVAQVVPPVEKLFQPQSEHFTVMLHLLTEHFNDAATALTALQKSAIFSIDSKTAQSHLADLQSQGLVEGAELTENGKETLRNSPYFAYAEALATKL